MGTSHDEEATAMKKSKFLIMFFVLIGLFALTLGPSFTFASTYTYSLDIFGKTYTAVVVTNSEVSNVTLSQSGLGIQFQASVPFGTTGFFNVTVPALLVGTDVTVLQDGVPLAKNVSYTQVTNGTDLVFHLEFTGGTHKLEIEAATTNLNTQTPIPAQNKSNFPIELIVVAAIGVLVAIGAAAFLAFKGAIFHKAGSSAGEGAIKAAKFSHSGGGGGGGPATVPVGANVSVHPHPNVGLTFSHVSHAGAATAVPLAIYPALPEGLKFIGSVFEIKTTAVFAGVVLVGIAFDGKDLSDEEKKKLRVYRNDLKKDSVWEDVTSSIDAVNNIAYGATDHFSGFGVH